jgi:hypothetical protein
MVCSRRVAVTTTSSSEAGSPLGSATLTCARKALPAPANSAKRIAPRSETGDRAARHLTECFIFVSPSMDRTISIRLERGPMDQSMCA